MNEFLKKALPWIGAAATGNVPALVTMAAKTISDAVGFDVDPTPTAITQAVVLATPEQLAAMQEKENEFKLKMQSLGFTHAEEMGRLHLAETQVFIEDTKDARDKFSANHNVFKLGVTIVLVFAITVGMSMWGAYLLLSGGITVKDMGIVAAVFSFLGTVVGYMAASAQQVVGYFFGSSKGSSDNREALASSIGQLGVALGKKQA